MDLRKDLEGCCITKSSQTHQERCVRPHTSVCGQASRTPSSKPLQPHTQPYIKWRTPFHSLLAASFLSLYFLSLENHPRTPRRLPKREEHHHFTCHRGETLESKPQTHNVLHVLHPMKECGRTTSSGGRTHS